MSAVQVRCLHFPDGLRVGLNSTGMLNPSTRDMSKKSRLPNWFRAYSARPGCSEGCPIPNTRACRNPRSGNDRYRRRQSCTLYDPRSVPWTCRRAPIATSSGPSRVCGPRRARRRPRVCRGSCCGFRRWRRGRR
ncbi:hypothetical protein RHGRI_020025 [Rhododendron griersonianum]|uniref:Uncharacterized protein n=1 Tax=Rhododendron griersonianum TaxID=479676 RepID=A0AAV6JGZ5_9ERIC|nr:hypothetical protein RHGRI_020025 [Rhododendron griersonianum]